MMNDRFSVELRKHLLETANERPAEGQLAAVVQGVAATGQRRSWWGRLTWYPGRVGPVPTIALRYGLIVLALALAAAATVLLAGGKIAFRSTVFEGTWTSIDPADRSTQTLVVAAGTGPAVHFEDDFASGAACLADPVKVFRADGTGEVSGTRMIVTYPDGGGCGFRTVPIAGVYDYDPGSDTLLDQDDLRWIRAEAEAVPTNPASTPPTATTATTAPPATEAPGSSPRESGPAATDATSGFPAFEPLPSYTCDLLSGTYGGYFGTILVTATTPTTWHGLGDAFHAEDEGCGGGAGVRIEVTVASAVYPDTCKWLGTDVEAGTAAGRAAAFSEQSLFEVAGPVDTELGGYPARRFDFTLPADLDTTTCSSSTIQLWHDPARDPGFGPTLKDPGAVTVYFVDVDAVTFGVYVFKGEGNSTPAMRADLDAVVDSLRFEPQAR